MSIKDEKEEVWIVGVGGSDQDGVSTYRVIGTKTMIKYHLLSLVNEDREEQTGSNPDYWEYGTESVDDIEEKYNGKAYYAYGCYSDHHIDYEATLDSDNYPGVLDIRYRELPQSYKDCIEKNDSLYEDIIKSLIMGNNIEFYDSVSAFGEDRSDNGCREDDDTDESFGLFLIQAYKDGQSQEILAEMPDGKVLSLSLPS